MRSVIVSGVLFLVAFPPVAFGALTHYADPFVGTDGTGHCTPAATRPFALVQPGPDSGNVGWPYCSGYQYRDKYLIGFSQTHFNGTGSTDFGDACIFPVAAKRALKSDEVAEPGYYAVTLDGNVRCEITSTERVAFYRFRFGEGAVPYLRLDTSYTISGWEGDSRTRVVEAVTNVWTDTKRSGSVRTKGMVADRWYHYVLEQRTDGREMRVKVALSATSVAGAERNLTAELPGWDFDAVRRESAALWERELARIPFPGGDEEAKRNFYTAVYHLCVQPNLISDVGDRPRYSTFSFWDTYRAAHTLYAEYWPHLVPDFVKSIVWQGRKTGYLPIWTAWGEEAQFMIGTHSIPVLVDWYFRTGGKGDIAWNEVYALVRDTLRGRHAGRRKEDWDLLDRYGYYPCDVIRGESVSRLLEGSFDDWCAARLARALGHEDDAEYFFGRAAAWKRMYDPRVGFMRGRTTKGGWREPFDPLAAGHNTDTDNDFTEGNAWQWTWHVLQDPRGLIELMGGTAVAERKLDALFSAPSDVKGDATTVDVSGLIGQYAHGNEPSHHIPFLYAVCGKPEKTRAIVKRICREFYHPRPDGLCGNDDCGQMSAWYVCALLGKYPVTPCFGGENANVGF